MMQPFYQPRGEDLQISVLTREFTFPTHLHAHVELAHAFSGPLAMWIDGQTWALEPGDTAIAFAHCAHAYLGGGEGLMLIFPPEISLDFGRALQTARCAQPVLRARDAHSDIPAMMRATLVEIQGEGARSKAALRAYIQVILARLLPALDMEKESAEAQSGLLYDTMRYLGEHFDQPLSLDALSRALGASKYHLSHLFSERLGMNFRSYLNALRVERARLLLTGTAAPITQICYECGFENQRTFNRAFLAACGTTPTRYRETGGR